MRKCIELREGETGKPNLNGNKCTDTGLDESARSQVQSRRLFLGDPFPDVGGSYCVEYTFFGVKKSV